MKTAKPKTESVYIRITHYRNKKLTKTRNMTVYDTDSDKVLALIKAAVERSANGKR